MAPPRASLHTVQRAGGDIPPSLHPCSGQQDKVSPRVQAADYPSKLLTLPTLLLRPLHTRVECSTHECRYCSHCESISISSAASDQNTLKTSLPFLALHSTFLSVNRNCIAPCWLMESHTAFTVIWLLFKQYTTEELKNGFAYYWWEFEYSVVECVPILPRAGAN